MRRCFITSGETTIRPPLNRRPTAPPLNGPRFNEFISVPKVRVIDENGENIGVLLTAEAIEQAAEVGLDLVEVKEIKLRPMIDDHDYQVKMRAMERFFEEGDKVKITMRFRGREMAHQHLGMELLTRVQKDTEVFAKLEQYPKMEGRQMMMVLAPR